MTIYVQEGWGKADKIDRAAEDGSIGGVIWSPRDEDPTGLPSTIARYRESYGGLRMLFDPQFYATTVVSPRAGKLPDYPYYRVGLSRSSFNDPQNIQLFVRETLDFQMTLPLDCLISPTILFSDFRDPASQVALMMANASASYHAVLQSPPPLLVSLVISEGALSSQSGLGDFLDDLSLLNVHGVYLIVRRNSQQYQAAYDPTHLENLLYLVHVLAEINQFEVICGYADYVGVLLHAVGAEATASGWYTNLRQFSLDRFQPASGGRQPRPRYSSLPLLNSVFINELDDIYDVGQIASVLTGTPYDNVFASTRNPANVPWQADISALHHWAVLARSAASVTGGNLRQRLDRCTQALGMAEALYNTLMQAGARFDITSDNRHLGQWRQALLNFGSRLGV